MQGIGRAQKHQRQAAVSGIEADRRRLVPDSLLKRRRQDGKRQLPAPVHVEMAAAGAVFAPFDNASPPGIFQRRRQMIGDDIEDDPDIGGAQRIGQALETIPAANVRIDLVGVADVIAMGGARDRSEYRRAIEMADAKPDQMRDKIDRRVECHPVSELQAIGGGGKGHVHSFRLRRIRDSNSQNDERFQPVRQCAQLASRRRFCDSP
jgi:hypothetical protein